MDSGNQVLFKAKICIFALVLFVQRYYFTFFLTLGPALPKALYGHSMLEIQGDVFLFGGYGSSYNSAIYQLSCSYGICSWATLNQALKVGRRYTAAIPVPDTFCT